MTDARSQRGSGMLIALIVVLVITAISVAMIRVSSRELAGATASRQSDALVACAEAGRQAIMAQFRSLGVAPTSLVALNVPLDGATGATRAVGGHVDDTSIQVHQVTVLPATVGGAQRGNIRDLTNIVTGAGQLGGTPYRIVVHCQDHGDPTDPTSGRQLEVEFGLRFGL